MVKKNCLRFFLFFFSLLNKCRDQSVSVRGAKAISENEIADSLPNESTERSGRLYDLAIDALASFVGSHSLELKFPKESSQELARAIEEGRGKLKKFIAPLILAFGAKIVALIPLFLGGLIFLAIKALIVSKIAFVLAALTGLQKLGAGAGGLNLLGKFTNGAAQPSAGWSSATPSAGWSSGTGAAAQYPYARNYDTAQDLAYNAYATDNSAQQQPQQ